MSIGAVLFVVYSSTSIHFAKLTQRETEIDSDLLITLLKSGLLILMQFYFYIYIYSFSLLSFPDNENYQEY